MLTIAHIRAIISEKREEVIFMFEDPGRIIQTLAKVFFWLAAITSVILAFVLGFEKEYYGWGNNYEIRFKAVAFFSWLIGGPLGAYISALLLVGFGELVENSGSQNIPLETKIKYSMKSGE